MGCSGNCLECGKCAGFPILDSFKAPGAPAVPRDGTGIAADIGTTTVTLALLSLPTGEVLARHSFINPQRTLGADVLTRIGAANGGEGERLRRVITDALSAGIEKLLAARGTPPGQVGAMVISGNTVMTHLLLGMPCEGLGTYPFRPGGVLREEYPFREVFRTERLNCPVRIVPWVSAFIGGDVAAGLFYVLAEGAERFLLADLGTNGEMAFYDRGKLVAASAAAGPAFEGGSGAGGASSIIRALAALRRGGYIDRTGRLLGHAPPVFTQEDIRDLQLAKSAIRSGIELLLEIAGEPDAVYLAGGIGQAVNPADAIEIGLLPASFKDKVRAVGNASLGGAARLLLDPDGIETVRELVSAAEVADLANHPRFGDVFMTHMGL